KDVASIIEQLGARAGIGKAALALLTSQAELLAQSLENIPNINRSVTIQYNTVGQPTGGAVQGGGHIVPAGGGAGIKTGGRIPGYGGGDIYPAMLEPGEAVVPKHLVPHIAGFLGAHGVPGFAHGGIIPDRGIPITRHHGLTPMEKIL